MSISILPIFTKLPKKTLILAVILFSAISIIAVVAANTGFLKKDTSIIMGSCPSKDYSQNRKVNFSWGKVDYIAKNEGDLLGIYKFPEFDLYAYQKPKPKKAFLPNLFSIQTNALSCYPNKWVEGGDYSLVNNDSNKKIEFGVDLVSAKNFYVGGNSGVATDGIGNDQIKKINPTLQRGLITGNGNARIILLDKKTGEFIQNPNKTDPNKYALTENDIDWSKLKLEQKTIIENAKKEIVDNFEFKYRELIDSGCVYTAVDCEADQEAPTKDSKTIISDKDKEIRLLTAQVGYGAPELRNPPAQRILDLSDPNNLKMELNIIFNYQKQSGEFLEEKNSCGIKNFYVQEQIAKLGEEACDKTYKIPKYNSSGDYKLIQIKANSTDKGQNWQANSVTSEEFQMPEDFVESEFNKKDFGGKYVPAKLFEKTNHPKELLNSKNEMIDKNGQNKDFNVYNYPYQHRIYLPN